MSNSIKMDLTLQDPSGSIKKRTSEVNELNKGLQSAQRLATGTRTGSGAVKAAQAPGMTNQQYNQDRGVAGSTGAAGRDFANQSAGLGGLVRLYATYAANIFALTAAFSALRDAMNTDTMVIGLNQLGAASGVSMGTLAKDFSKATDGAISLRESMEATAKAVSSGLSRSQFLELGKVAKGASQALGTSMSDAVSRLTRGITKLEPELLDELGIFTKVGKATEDYARSIGKSVTSLTDFEKRQAFANAVLAEGSKKFGEIAIESNPYDKLLASLKDTAQGILSIVNTIITPIAKILADNTGLIAAAMGLLGIKIVQQALPALTSWQKGLAQAAQVSAGKLGDLVSPEGFVERAQAKFNVPRLEAEVAKAERVYAAAAKSFVDTDNNYKRKGTPLLKAMAAGATIEGPNYINAVKQVSVTTDNLTAAEQRHIVSLKAATIASNELLAARLRLATANQLVEGAADAPLTLREKAQMSRYKQAAGSSARLGILSKVSGDYDTEGFTQSIKNANNAAKNSGSIGKLGQIFTTVGATAIASAKAISLFGGGLLRAIPYIGIAYTAYELLSAGFSKNSKEAGIFRDSLEELSNVGQTNADVFTKFGNVLTVESLNAKATAFGDLATAIQKSTSALEKAQTTSGWFDKLVDIALVPIDKDLASSYAKNIGFALSQGIKNIPDSTIQGELVQKLKLETGAASASAEDLSSALDKIDKKDIVQKGDALLKLVNSANKVLQTSRGLSQDVQAAIKSTADAELNLRNSLQKPDTLGLYYEGIVKQLDATKKGLLDITAATAEFQKISKGEANISFLGSAGSSKLVDIASEYASISNVIKYGTDALDDNQKELANINGTMKTWMYTSFSGTFERRRDELVREIAAQKGSISSAQSKLKELAAQTALLFQEAYTKAYDNAIESSSRKSKMANLEFSKNKLASSPVQTPESIKKQFEIDRELLKLKKDELTSQYNLIDALDRATASNNILEAKRTLATTDRNDADLRKRLNDTIDLEEAKLALINRNVSKEQQQILRTRGGADAVALQNRRSNSYDARNQYNSSLEMSGINEQQSLQKLGYQDLAAIMNDQKTGSEQALEALKQSTDYLAASDSKRAEMEKPLKEQLSSLTAVIQTLPAALDVALTNIVGTPEQKAKALDTLRTAQGSANTGTSLTTAAGQRTISGLQTVESLNSAYSVEKDRFRQQTESLDVQKLDLEYRTQALAKDLERGTISQELFNTSSNILETETAALTSTTALLAEREKFAKAELDIRTKIAEAGGTANPEQLKALKDAKTEYDSGTSAILRQYDASLKLLDLNKELSERQKGYADAFGKAFDGMTDAILNFAKTGKLSFTDMISSFIEDLIRLEIKQMQMNFLKSQGGLGGLATSFMNAIGAGGSTPLASAAAASGIISPNAKGGSFDYGIQKFAKGGTFTNSVVGSPTLFKFAQGTGLMGEAGPEAIMPLKRDANGNLGVRAGEQSGGNVEVVVNNYGSEKAETKETTDSRGNRKIEVIIGEMNAGELAKSGSASQRALGGTYGLRPQLIRR